MVDKKGGLGKGAKAKPEAKKKLQIKKGTVKDLTRDEKVKGGAPHPGHSMNLACKGG